MAGVAAFDCWVCYERPLEWSVIRERVVAGLDFARAHGAKSGRPIERPRILVQHDQVAALRSNGLSWRQIAVGSTPAPPP